jgi:hypothetical protein
MSDATVANDEYSSKQNINYTMLQAFEWYLPDGGKHWTVLKVRFDSVWLRCRHA